MIRHRNASMQALAVKSRLHDHLKEIGVPKHAYGIERDPNGWNVTIIMGGRTLSYHVTATRNGSQQLADLQHIKQSLTALGLIGEQHATGNAGADLRASESL